MWVTFLVSMVLTSIINNKNKFKMKKVLALIAIIGFVACNSAETTAPAVDTTAAPKVDSVAAPVDSVAAPVDSVAAPATK
jgi:uncharacterized lipoprotein YajG